MRSIVVKSTELNTEKGLKRNVEAVLTGTDGVPLAEIDARLEELQKELLKVANAKGNYDSIVDEIYSLREAKQNAQVDNAEREGMKQRISEMQQFLTEQTQNITEYDEQLVRRLIEKITVYGGKVTVEFKSGTSVDDDNVSWDTYFCNFMPEVTFDSRKQADSVNHELSNIDVKMTETAVLDRQQRLTS